MKKNIFKFYGNLILVLFFVNSIYSQNNPPIFTSTPVISIEENQTYVYDITTTDAEGDPVTVTATTLPSWLNLTTNTIVSTLAGFGTQGFADGTGTTAQFNNPTDVAVDASGNVYVADYGNNRIRKITSAGVVTTLAGSGTQGFVDATGTTAQFWGPSGVAVDGSGTVYVADTFNNCIRTITSSGVVTTLAGSGTAGFTDGTGAAAQFNEPSGIAIDASGTVYVADTYNHRIRKITAAGVVTTLAGSGTASFTDGTGVAAQFNQPVDITVDGGGTVYVSDKINSRIRKITAAGVVTTLAGSGTQGFAEGTGVAAQFSRPFGMAVAVSGTAYVADFGNNRIRKITSAGEVTTFAGSGTYGFADGASTIAQFRNPAGIAIGPSNTFYVADYNNNRIRKITQSTGFILTGLTNVAIGNYPVVLHADDGNGGTADQSFTISIISDTTAPIATALVPADNATDVTSSNLQIAFNEDIKKGTGDILIKRLSDGQAVATIPVNGQEVTIDNTAAKGAAIEGVITVNISPTLSLPSNTDLYVDIPTGTFTDITGNDFAGLSSNTQWNFSTGSVLGIEGTIIKGFAMYPNPVKDELNIRAQESLKRVQVFNLMGQQLIQISPNSNKVSVDLSRLPQGAYFIKVTTDISSKAVKVLKR